MVHKDEVVGDVRHSLTRGLVLLAEVTLLDAKQRPLIKTDSTHCIRYNNLKGNATAEGKTR